MGKTEGKTDRIKRVAAEALARGADPQLANRILSSSIGEEGAEILERRLQALLDTVPEDRDREELALMMWGEWDSRNIRIGMPEAEWRRVQSAAQKLPGRSQAERLGLLLQLGARLVEEEGPGALGRLG